MMKERKAEEAALMAYPREEGKIYSTAFGTIEFDRNAAERKGFREGYEQAEKDTIDYACYELEFRLPEYLNYNGIQVERAEFIKDFRKAMED